MAEYGGCKKDRSFAEARTICEGAKDKKGVQLRLCTVEEIKGGRTAGTGCGFDFHMVWTTPTAAGVTRR